MLADSNTTPAITRAIDSFLIVALAAFASLIVAQGTSVLRHPGTLIESHITLTAVVFLAVYALVCNKCLGLSGVYDSRAAEAHSILKRAAQSSLYMTLAFAFHIAFTRSVWSIVATLALFFALAYLFLIGRFAIGALPHRRLHEEKVLILGTGRRAQIAWRHLRVTQHRSLTFLGFLDDCEHDSLAPDIRYRYLGRLTDLPEYLVEHSVDSIVVATSLRTRFEETRRAVAVAELFNVRVLCMSDAFEVRRSAIADEHTPVFVELHTRGEAEIFRLAVKYFLDKVIAIVILVLTSPLLLALCLLRSLFVPGPPLVSRACFGYNRRPFGMLFLNTGQDDKTDAHTQCEGRPITLPAVTIKRRIGLMFCQFLRTSYFDRIPQLINVLAGEMSLVGPEAMTTPRFSPLEHPAWADVFRARPGVCRPSNLIHERLREPARTVAIDSSYLRGWSLRVDAKLMGLLLLQRSGWTRLSSPFSITPLTIGRSDLGSPNPSSRKAQI
jgi:lipopolysaccharide/colanic/teichoic acid biosynthesis glycosyltransferase